MVNDRLVCFDEVFEMVMNSTINVTLPPNFLKPAPKIPSYFHWCRLRGGRRKKEGEEEEEIRQD